MSIKYYKLKMLHEVADLSVVLSEYFPAPSLAALGIYELLINAIEHGNLGITHAEKQQLIFNGGFEDEINARQAMPENANKHVDVALFSSDEICIITITDQGAGFNWKQYIREYVADDDVHGRGIMLARNCGFDSVAYNDAGNSVICASKKIVQK